MSGMYDLKPVRLSWRSSYVKFDDAMEQAMSSIRHIDNINAAVTVTHGTFETPEFQRQGRDFAAALKQAGKHVTHIEAQHYAHRGVAWQSLWRQWPRGDGDDGAGADLKRRRVPR
jgi:arylformamidase